MADELISRQAVLAEMRRSGRAAYMIVQAATAVDAVEVVRCGECIHRGKDSWCAYVDDDPDFFCKRGRRVTNAADNG